jgi:release factor glutamine methyltransferase
MPRTPLARTTIRDALDSALIALTASGCETPRLDAEVLLAAAMGVSRAVVVADPSREIDPGAARTFQDWARRRAGREPVAYILGSKGFRRLDLIVDPRVLVPRPETEHLVEACLSSLPAGARVVDVGTGSGAVALALKDERPDLQVIATDNSREALDLARFNAARLGLTVEWVHTDLLEGVREVDAVVSNPPYVRDGERLPPEVAHFEPGAALFAGPDGLDVYRRLVPAVRAPFVALEVGAGQAPVVSDLLGAAGFSVSMQPDLAGIDRVVVGRRA